MSAIGMDAPRGSDTLARYDFPVGFNLTTYTAQMTVYTALNGTVLLTFGTEAASANGSLLSIMDNILYVSIEKADVDALPLALDPTEINYLFFSIEITSSDNVTTKIYGGYFRVLPLGYTLPLCKTSIQVNINNNLVTIDFLTGLVGIRGLTAYEIAVQYGYGGTEAEWVALTSGVLPLFADIGSLFIPNNVDLIKTSGFSVVGIGDAEYVAITDTGQLETAYMRRSLNGRLFLLNQKSPSIEMFGALAGIDCLSAFNSAVAYLTLIGGGNIVFPKRNGAIAGKSMTGWFASGVMRVAASNISIILQDNVAYSGTFKSAVFSFEGTTTTLIENNAIYSLNGKMIVDANGNNNIGYVYSTSDGYYSCVLFKYCRNWLCQNIHGYNGLVNCLVTLSSGFGEFIDCEASYAVYDNGISIDFNPKDKTYSDSDPSTWSNANVIRPVCHNNHGLGLTAYAAIGVTMDCPLVYANGNDIAAQPNNGGGISVEQDTNGSPTVQARDSRCTIISPRVLGNNNSGIFVAARNVKIISPVVRDTIAPVNRPNPGAAFYGSNITILANGSVVQSGGGENTGAGAYGVIVLAAGGIIPSFRMDSGLISKSTKHGIYARGVNQLFVGDDVTIEYSGWNSSTGTISNSNWNAIQGDNSSNGYNTDLGVIRIGGRISYSAGRPVDLTHIGEVELTVIRGVGNRYGVASLGSQFRTQYCPLVVIDDIHHNDISGSPFTTSIIEIQSTCGVGRVGNVTGDCTSNIVLNLAPVILPAYYSNQGCDVYLREFFAPGSSGGSASAGRNTRQFNTTVINKNGLATGISGGLFTLPAGTYQVHAEAPAHKVGLHAIYLRNLTDGLDITQGTMQIADPSLELQSTSVLDRVITLTSSTQLSIQHQCQIARATDGLGVTGYVGITSYYAFLQITKL